MINLNFIKIFNLLKINELDGFLKYVQHPFDDSPRYKKELETLVKNLGKQKKSGEPIPLDKAELMEWVTKKKLFPLGVIDKVLNEGNRLLKKYILINNYINNEQRAVEVEIDFAEFLHHRQGERAEDLILKVIDELNHIPERGTETAYLLYRSEYVLSMIQSHKFNWKSTINIENTINALDRFYFLRRLRYVNYLKIFSTHYIESFNNDFFTNYFLGNKESALFGEFYAIYKVEKEIYKMLSSQVVEKKDLDIIFNMLKEIDGHADKEFVVNNYSILRSTCNHLISKGHTEIYEVLHKINIDNLERGILYVDGKLNTGAFLSITKAGLMVGWNDWVFDFIKTHKNRILAPIIEQDNYWRICMSLYYFYIKKYKDSFEYIPVYSDDIALLLLIKRTEIMLYYEINSEIILSKIASLRMFISRSSKTLINDQMRIKNNNFINIVAQLLSHKLLDKKHRQKIIDRIQNEEAILEKEWLLEKAQALK